VAVYDLHTKSRKAPQCARSAKREMVVVGAGFGWLTLPAHR
jgi:hypothetical protein